MGLSLLNWRRSLPEVARSVSRVVFGGPLHFRPAFHPHSQAAAGAFPNVSSYSPDSDVVRHQHLSVLLTHRTGPLVPLLIFFMSSGCVYLRPDGSPPEGIASYWWDDTRGPDNGAPGDWQNYGY